MNRMALTAALEANGLWPVVMGFDEVDLRDDWQGVPVVYTSSEDPGLHYKSYIEDVVLGLDRRGAHLLPRFDLLRAHHNKVYMEMLRKILLPDDPLTQTATFGTLEEYRRSTCCPEPPVFVKGAAGAGSSTVRFAVDERSAMTAARRLTQTLGSSWNLRSAAKVLLRPGFVPNSAHRGKFVVQRAVPDLPGDFKVLRYGRRYYAVFRRNRSNSPRASGGEQLDFEVSRWIEPVELLLFARDIAQRIDSPFLSMDIAQAADGLRLLEFQAVCFGAATLQRGTHHFVESGDTFTQTPNTLSLEEVFADAVKFALLRNAGHVSS